MVCCRHRARPRTACSAIFWICSIFSIAASQECYCHFEAALVNNTVPSWGCNNGVRQYHCLLKTRQGKWSVARGDGQEQLALMEYCSAERAPETCTLPAPEGFTLHRGDWRAIPELKVEVSCPENVNCSRAIGFLGPSCPGRGPANVECNVSNPWWRDRNCNVSDEFAFVTAAPRMEIRSPTLTDYAYSEPFGYYIHMENETVLVADHGKEKIWVFHRNDTAISNGLLGYWNTIHSSIFNSYPVLKSQLYSNRMMGISRDGLVFATHKHPMTLNYFNPGYKEAKAIFDVQPGQEVYLLPGSADGSLGVKEPVILGSRLEPHGWTWGSVVRPWSECCIAAAVSGDYVIAASATKTVWIFERANETWQSTDIPTHTWGSFLTNPSHYDEWHKVDGFGELVAIESGGTAMVAAWGTTRKVYVFDRGPNVWPSAANSEFGPYPAKYGFPSAMTISGRYAVISFLSHIYVLERSWDGYKVNRWTVKLELHKHAVAHCYLGPAIAINDRGDGDATLVVGLRDARRALLVVRNASTDAWEAPVDLLTGSAPNPDGFGRTVGASGDTVIVGTNLKKLFVYTRQLAGTISSTIAAPLTGGPQRYALTFDGRKMIVGRDHTLCLDLDGQGEAFINYHLYNIVLKEGGLRSVHAEEL